jgi:hypothetical protein
MNELVGLDTDSIVDTDTDTDNVIDSDGVINIDNIIDTDDVTVVDMNELVGIDTDKVADTGIAAAIDTGDAMDEAAIAAALEAEAARPPTDIPVDMDIDNVNLVDMDDLSDDPFTIVPGVDHLSDDPFTSVPGVDRLADDPFTSVPVAPDVPSVDDVQDKIRQLFLEESSDPDSGMDSGIDSVHGVSGAALGTAVGHDSIFAGPDERDTPFDLPDHVLTSTLADIYYQQGQPQLALHIYERLVLRDPADTRLLAKVDEIRGVLRQLGEGGTAAPVEAVRPEKAPSASSGRKKKAPVAAARADTRPLAGVKIKKSAPSKQGKRAKS